MSIVEKIDTAAGFEILDDFVCFHQKDDLFRRSWWDERVRSEKAQLFYATYREPLKTFRKADGFTQRDYALRNAAWHVSKIFIDMPLAHDQPIQFGVKAFCEGCRRCTARSVSASAPITRITASGGTGLANGWQAHGCADYCWHWTSG